MVHEDHGDERHITLEKLEEAADAAGVSVEEAAQNIQAGLQKEPVEAAEIER
jgi:hypothetical protein